MGKVINFIRQSKKGHQETAKAKPGWEKIYFSKSKSQDNLCKVGRLYINLSNTTMLIFSLPLDERRNTSKCWWTTEGDVHMQDRETGELRRVTVDGQFSSRFLCTAQYRLLANGKCYFLGESLKTSTYHSGSQTKHSLLCFRRESSHFDIVHQW